MKTVNNNILIAIAVVGMIAVFYGATQLAYGLAQPKSDVDLTEITVGDLETIQIIAFTIYQESKSEGEDGMHAVASVIHNRTTAANSSYRETCLKPYQFSCWNAVDWRQTKLHPALGQSLTSGEKKALAESLEIAQSMVLGTFEPTGPWNHFHNPVISSPEWSAEMQQVTFIGRHKFGVL